MLYRHSYTISTAPLHACGYSDSLLAEKPHKQVLTRMLAQAFYLEVMLKAQVSGKEV